MASSSMATSVSDTHPHQQRPPAAHHSYSYAPYQHTHAAAPMAQPQAYYQQAPPAWYPHPGAYPQQQLPGGQYASGGAGPSHQTGGSGGGALDAAYLAQEGQSTSASRARPSSHYPSPSPSNMPMIPHALPVPESTTSTSHAYASSHTHTAQQQASRAANRRSHNPGATLGTSVQPRSEELTDEYVLHPSVYAFKQEFPRRAMVGLGPYIVLHTLGEGEFGKVKLGVHADYGVEVAIKLIRRGDLQEEAHASKVEREINVLKTLKHPNIVRMFDVLDTHKYIGIVLEFAGGGELFEYILANEYLKDKEGQRIFAQLMSGVDYLHKKGVIHRDLKLENLLLDKNRNLIITDFGFANQFRLEEGDFMKTSCGSPCYAAPELVILDTPYSGSAVDIWSCGVILFAMLAGYLPYDDDPDNPDAGNVVDLYRYIMNTELHYPDHVSQLGKNLLQHMLILHPDQRVQMPEIISHPWLKPHRGMFGKTVEECEAAFQDAMYRKSKQARKELQERRRVQTQWKEAMQGRDARAFVAQRSQSSAPGTTVSSAALDTNRWRPHSPLPGTTTMPELLAGQALPVADASHPGRPTTPVRAAPAEPIPISIDSPRRRSESMTVGLASTAPPVVAPITAEAQPLAPTPDVAESLPAATTRPVEQKAVQNRPSMRDNKNRHTIQVEYDGDASYEKMKEALEAKNGRGEGSAETGETGESGALAPPLPGVRQGDSSDVEMESGSSDNGHHKTAESTEDDQVKAREPEPVVAPAPLPPLIVPTSVPLAPPAESSQEQKRVQDVAAVAREVPLPETPLEQAVNPMDEVVSPSTPRASVSAEREEVNVTPRAKTSAAAAAAAAAAASVTATPKASLRAADRRRHDSMPPALGGPSASVPEPRRNPELNISGLPRPPKKDRYKKGMSLDKFSLSRLLGSPSQAPSPAFGEGRMAPPSASASAVALQNQLQAQQQERMAGDTDSARLKKAKRKTLQLGFHGRRDSRAAASTVSIPGTPLTDRDTNGENRLPVQAPGTADSLKGKRRTLQLGFSRQNTREEKIAPSPKVNNAPLPEPKYPFERKPDLVVNPEVANAASAQPHGQSSPSIVTVDHISAQQAGYPGHRGASSKAAKVMDWFRRKTFAKDTMGESIKSPGLKSDSQSSFVQVGVNASPKRKMAGEAGNLAMTSFDSVDRTEEGPSGVAVAEEPQAAVQPQPESPAKNVAAATPSVTVTRPSAFIRSPTTPALHSSPSAVTTRPRSATTFDETKIRLHTGLVDQSALTTKPPIEVFKEVMQVMQGMGVEMKRESDFKLRCTRAKRRAGGANTGLGLGSVISTGSGMNPFSLMNSASTSKTDSRGLPMPTSPSLGARPGGGLKGLLRRGSSRSTHPAGLSRNDSEIVLSPSASTPNLELPEMASKPKPEPLYGEKMMDAGDEVKFTVELCKMKNLPGLYILKIKRTKGNLWSFKFIYQTVIERTTTLTH